jgi:hypothetical protein
VDPQRAVDAGDRTLDPLPIGRLAPALKAIEHNQLRGRIDVTVHLAAIERRIVSAEHKVWR